MGFICACFGSIDSRTKNDDRVSLEMGSPNDQPSTLGEPKRYTWEDLQKYTHNFKQMIGVGGYSRVYLAKFPDSTFGAVKVYNCSERLNQIFKNELEISQKLHHPNIAKLLGYCDERDEGVLVFEYIPNGNLQQQLHNQFPTSENNIKKSNNKSKQQFLTWKQRMSIAYQLAESLKYLHETCNLNIVHGDIKSSNVLLDEDLNTMLCDFGFAKMGFSSMVKPASSSRLAMMGSPGYIDPHFLMTGIVSKKSDVYSFGVILLELITGFEPFLCSGEQQVLLTSLSRTKECFDVEKVSNMVDPRFGRKGEEVDKLEVKAMATIAGLCLHHLPSLRPSASEICGLMKDKVSSVPLLVSSSHQKLHKNVL